MAETDAPLATFRVGLLTDGEHVDFLEAVAGIADCAGAYPLAFELVYHHDGLDPGTQALLRRRLSGISLRHVNAPVEAGLASLIGQTDEIAGARICIALQPRHVVPALTFFRVAQHFRQEALSALAYVERLTMADGARDLPADGRAVLGGLDGTLPSSAFFIRAGARDCFLEISAGMSFQSCLAALARRQAKASRLDRTQIVVLGRIEQAPVRTEVGCETYRRRDQLAVEHGWFPRYGLIDVTNGETRLLSDPEREPEVLSSEDFLARLTRVVLERGARGALPEVLIFIKTNAWSAIARSRLAAFVLDHCAELLSEEETVLILVAASCDGAIRVRPALRIPSLLSLADGSHELGICAILTERLINCVLSGRISHFSALAELPITARPLLSIEVHSSSFDQGEPSSFPAARPDTPVSAMVRWMVRLRATLPVLGNDLRARFALNRDVLSLGRQLHRSSFGSDEAFPIGGISERDREAVFLLPVFSFGGVERVCLRVAQGLRRFGYSTTIVVLDRSEVEGAQGVIDAFDRIIFLKPGQSRRPLSDDEGDRAKLIRIARCADVFVPTHVVDIHVILDAVRMAGVAVVSHLHLLAQDPDLRPAGHPYVVSDNQHLFDGVIAISRQLVNWSIAQGLRPSRVLYVPNASAHFFDGEAVSRSRLQRANRIAGDGLKILFLGRLDAEKGLHRLAALADHVAANARRLSLRVVGANVVDDEVALPLSLQNVLFEPSFDPMVLAAHYTWADVLIVPSFHEGIPLTILEASIFGVVPIATRVGAIDEVIDDGKTGVLIDPGQELSVAHAIIRAVDILAADIELLQSMSLRRQEAVWPHDHWHDATSRIATFFDGLIERKASYPSEAVH